MNAAELQDRLAAARAGDVPDVDALVDGAFPEGAMPRAPSRAPLLRLLTGAALAAAAGAPLWIAPSRAEQERATALATRTLAVAERFAQLNRTTDRSPR